MKAKAAILWERNTPWSVEEIELADPKDREVLIKMVASGMCHSDDHAVTGDLEITTPIIGGHEGAGIVEKIGPNVRDVEVGDHVVLSFIPSCGKCRWCSTGHSNLCDLGAVIMGGKQLDGTTRAVAGGKDVGAMALLGTFSNYAVVPESSVVKIHQWIPLEKACLVGCGVTTGWGSAVNTGEVSPGDTVVVVGVGGIGGGAIQGAKIAGARYIVAIDISPDKKSMAETLGATHFAQSIDEAMTLVNDLTWGVMADVSILTVGVATGDMVQQMVGLVRKGGKVVLTAIAPIGAMDAQLHMAEVTLFQKQLRGSLFGECNPRADIPRLLDLYQSDLLKLDEMITKEYKLEDVNEGYADMKAGTIVRGVIIHEH
ncbi:NDMA-dependent alcohol dehydrogenase [Rhodococcus erythropolis]|uniref:NDMA-dependent alcohol dehydrogenase n=1 Tax=Rhodococcus erythropolis TaxID=1833 RepID=UPI003825D444